MEAYIQQLRSKPEHIRKQLLVTYTAIAMVIVGAIWIYSLTDRFSTSNPTLQSKDNAKPFSMLGDTLKQAYNGISASVGSVTLPKMDVAPSTKVVPLTPVEPAYQPKQVPSFNNQ